MIRQIDIANFKSIDHLSFGPGRVSLLIGENGCGKTNVLEAIALGAAAAAGKLDNEFLRTRGIRVANPVLMRSAFAADSQASPIEFRFYVDGGQPRDSLSLSLQNDNKPYAGWTEKYLERAKAERAERGREAGEVDESVYVQAVAHYRGGVTVGSHHISLTGFLAYSPQITILREQKVESYIEPLGIHGEGLFRLLATLAASGRLAEVQDNLRIIDWFDKINVTTSPHTNEAIIGIKDRYLSDAAPLLDEANTNEGFLYLLFYTCLFMSEHTPKFFAIDNVESALNPKLCVKLMQTLVALAKKYDKQAIITTHSPAILDGLDLSDDQQRLFVAYRNVEGATRMRRVERPVVKHGEKTVPLSEAFLRGYIGGLPANF